MEAGIMRPADEAGMSSLCRSCTAIKDIERFRLDPKMSSGRRNICKDCENKRMREYRKRGYVKDYYKRYFYDNNTRIRFKIDHRQYSQMLDDQNHLCAICEQPEKIKNRRLAIDHSHESNNIRGLLCGACNKALGLFSDNPEFLRRAADYIERNQ